MGYSDEPLSEHSLTGTRNRPLNHETQEGQGRVGREARRHECVTKHRCRQVCGPSTSFDDPPNMHTCHNKLLTLLHCPKLRC